MLFLAFKHLFGRIKVSIMTFLGIMVGSAAFIIISGFFLGFQGYMTDSLVNGSAHITVSAEEEVFDKPFYNQVFYPNAESVSWTRDPFGNKTQNQIVNIPGWITKLDKDPQVESYTPVYSTTVLTKYGDKTISLSLVGIIGSEYVKVTNIKDKMDYGDFTQLDRGLGLVVIGSKFADKLGLHKDDILHIVSSAGQNVPLKVIGAFTTGTRGSDKGQGFVNLKDAQRIGQAAGNVSQIYIRTTDFKEAGNISTEWQKGAQEEIESWDQQNANILSVFATQDMLRFMVTFVILLVAGFSIYNILNMTIQQKKKEIAILRSMGFEAFEIGRLFLFQGVILGIAGSMAGCLFGYLVCVYLTGLKMGTPMGPTNLNMSFDQDIYIKGMLLGNLSAIIASYIPAALASKMEPIEIIREGAE